MGFLFLITFIFLRTENSNAENSLPIITLTNSGIIDINNIESITTTIMPNTVTTTISNNNSLITSDDVIIENENLDNLNAVTISAALVRSRREPPITIIKHRSRPVSRRPKPRRRIKKPKIRYGPPNYNFGEPLSYYKPAAEIFDTGINSYKNENNDNIYDNANFKKEYGTDFNIQSFELSDYEKQPIAVNFYGRGGSVRSGSNKRKKPSFPSDSRNFKSTYTPSQIPSGEQNYQTPGGQYWEQFAESPSIIPPIPSNDYGIPSENNYPSSQNNYQLPQSNYPSPQEETYELPDQNIYQPFSPDSYNLPTQNNYESQTQHPPKHPRQHPPQDPPQTYQPQPPNNYNTERHKFTESPANVQWKYQQSYDNNPMPDYTAPQLPKPTIESNRGEFNGPKYLPPPEDDVEGFIDPNNNNNGYFAEPPTHYNKYSIPGRDLALPLDESHKAPSYDYPKSSYEVPIYNSIPFNTNDATPVQQISYPPNDLYSPEFSPPSTKISRESSNKIEITEAQPNIKNIQTFSTSLEELLEPDYFENISTTNKYGNRRKRKRTRDSTKNNQQHILDTDELRQAFGSIARIEQKYKLDSFPEEQQIQSHTNKREPENFVLITSTNGGNSGESSVSQQWEPIKTRQNKRENHKINNLQNNENNQQNINNSSSNKIANTRNIRLERTTEKTFKDIQVISIEKSHSHSFYAGTMSPLELMEKYPGIKTREDNGAVYVSSHINVGEDNNNNNTNDNEKRKGQVFDEELGDRNLPGNELPKNHKYF